MLIAKHKIGNHRKGFGILEVMIASMILVTVVGAVVAMGSASVRGGLTASDKTTAYNLAQECLEKARSVRDGNWVDQNIPTATEWNTNLTTANLSMLSECKTTSVGTPQVEYTRGVVVTNVPWFDPTSGDPPQYGVPLQDIPEDMVQQITVTVSWLGENSNQSLTGSTYLTDWKMIN
ncbi:MAG: hypothetical protein Q7S37_01560 [bacterium]|nr:hypothetical protein [bacterium]